MQVKLGVLQELLTTELNLNGVRVAGLAQDLEQDWVRHEKEAGKEQTFALQVAVKSSRKCGVIRAHS